MSQHLLLFNQKILFMILHFLLFYPIKRQPAKTNLSKLYYFHPGPIRKVSFDFSFVFIVLKFREPILRKRGRRTDRSSRKTELKMQQSQAK